MAERIDRLEAAVEKLVEALGKGTKLAPWLYVRSEEYFDYDESVALPCTTSAGAPHEFKERPMKFLWLYAAGAPIQVSLNRAVSGESFVVPNGAIIWIRKLTKRVYGTALVGTATLYIWGFC